MYLSYYCLDWKRSSRQDLKGKETSVLDQIKYLGTKKLNYGVKYHQNRRRTGPATARTLPQGPPQPILRAGRGGTAGRRLICQWKLRLNELRGLR